jgi:hypothetical protein
VTVSTVLDSAGRRRSPATLPGYLQAARRATRAALPARPPDRRGDHHRRATGRDDRHGARSRALIVVLWRAGLRVQEALVLIERDLDPPRARARTQRQGRPTPRDRHGHLGWEQLRPWLAALPVGPLTCIFDGPTRGRAWSRAGVSAQARPRSRRWRVVAASESARAATRCTSTTTTTSPRRAGAALTGYDAQTGPARRHARSSSERWPLRAFIHARTSRSSRTHWMYSPSVSVQQA